MNNKILFLIFLVSIPVVAQQQNEVAPTIGCSYCEEWNKPHRPFRIYGNSYYVGTGGLSAILVASSAGHVLIDGALPESAPLIEKSIRDLGFKVEDVKLILNSHAHYDHAGGVAALQKVSGAKVAASPASAAVLKKGDSLADDPQHGQLLPFPAVKKVREISDGETLKVGAIEMTAYFTPGHTRGGTTWSWRSCENKKCVDMVYVDSLTPVAAEGFMFGDNESYPGVVKDFEHSFEVLGSL